VGGVGSVGGFDGVGGLGGEWDVEQRAVNSGR
jgi:hypothetical protein